MHGIMVGEIQALEGAARIAAVAFDKTGTLTTGRLRLARVERPPVAHGHEFNDDELIRLAAAIEG